MPERSFPRLRVTCFLPELLDDLEFRARPPLNPDDLVYAYTGPARGEIPEGCRPVQLEPGVGPWYPAPSDAVEED